MNLSALVEPDRAHKTVYTDQQIFDQEMACSGRPESAGDHPNE